MKQGVRHDHECLTHIMDIDTPFPGVVRVSLTVDKCIVIFVKTKPTNYCGQMTNLMKCKINGFIHLFFNKNNH